MISSTLIELDLESQLGPDVLLKIIKIFFYWSTNIISNIFSTPMKIKVSRSFLGKPTYLTFYLGQEITLLKDKYFLLFLIPSNLDFEIFLHKNDMIMRKE